MTKAPKTVATWHKAPFTVEEETRAVYLRWAVRNADKALVAYLPSRELADKVVDLMEVSYGAQ